MSKMLLQVVLIPEIFVLKEFLLGVLVLVILTSGYFVLGEEI